MKRRTFLKTSVVAGTLATLGGATWWFTHGISVHELERILARGFRDKEDAYLIGKAYLEKVPSENDLDFLKKVLGERFKRARACKIDHEFETLIEEDFALGDFLEVNGWIVSETEVRLCAFMLLLKQNEEWN